MNKQEQLILTKQQELSHFEIVDAASILPISDHYEGFRLKNAIQMTNEVDWHMANGILAKVDGKLYDLAGRYRNFAATKYALGVDGTLPALIPVNVVSSLDSAVALYAMLSGRETNPLKKLEEPIEKRWKTLAKQSEIMKENGYNSLVDVVKKHHMYHAQGPFYQATTSNQPLKPALF